MLISADRIITNQQLTTESQARKVLIDGVLNMAKVATWWLHGLQSGYTVATRKRGNQWQDQRKALRQT
ncbi:MAG: hypothetical protein V9G23_17975 [Giesbergeria sp.]